MNGPGLVSFPLPMVTALLCLTIAILVLRLPLGVTRARVTFSAFFGLCAVEAALVGLRFGYGVADLVPVQRVLPLFLGPLIYLGFVAMTVNGHAFRRTVTLHLSIPILAVWRSNFWPGICARSIWRSAQATCFTPFRCICCGGRGRMP